MKKVFGFIGQVLVLAFAAAIIIYTTSLTFLLASKIVPENILLQAMVCILFDGAAFVWFVLFITRSNSVLQWGISALSWIVSMVGVAIMSAGELVMSQKLFNAGDPEKLGLILVVTVIVAAVYNAVMVYLFHFTDQVIINGIENSITTASAAQKVFEAARKQIEGGDNSQVQAAGRRLADGLINHSAATIMREAVKYERETTGMMEVIDGRARDIPPQIRQSAAPERVFAIDDTQPVKVQAKPVTANPTPPAKGRK